MKPLSARELNTIRGKMLMEHPSPKHDVWKVFGYIDWLEHNLDTKVDFEDGLGTEGWRKFLGHPDAE